MQDKNKVIIFDGDDTLWKTQELYDNAKKQFDELMKAHGFNEDIITLLDEIDAQRVEILKFSKSRFLESMLITYAVLCGKYKKKWDIKIEEKIRDFAKYVFQFPPVLYEDTVETLKTLSSYFGLILFTSGDKEIQEQKVDSLGKEFISYFSKVYLTEMKTKEEYKKILNEIGLPPQNIWVIGNSVKSDVNPAIKLGFKAILIPRGIWKYDKKERLISKKVPIVYSLAQAKDMILRQEKLK